MPFDGGTRADYGWPQSVPVAQLVRPLAFNGCKMPQSKRENPAIRPLPVLRAMVDAIDRDILQLLARRNGLIADIAEHKRENHVPIRDFEREREIIDDRRSNRPDAGPQRGTGREPVATRHVGQPRPAGRPQGRGCHWKVEPRTVAIIGGKGGMGHCLAQMFGDLGHVVMIADLDTRLSPEQAAAVADVVVISVPIGRNDAGDPPNSAHMCAEDALLMDVTSIKSEPMDAMLSATKASVVGTHPLFGPTVHSLQGQRVVITPGRGEEWLEWLKTECCTARGLEMVETSPEQHDRAIVDCPGLDALLYRGDGPDAGAFAGSDRRDAEVYLADLPD